jgi:translocation protein SEC63
MLALAGRIPRTPNLETLENAMKLSPLIVQALWDSKNSLLQLPHVTEDMLRHFTNRKRNVRNIPQLASMKSDERRSMLRNMTDEQYDDVLNVISKLPLLEIDVRSEVLDDEDGGTITAGAIVTVTVTLCRKNMSVEFDKENIKEKYSIDNEEVIEEIEGLPNGDPQNIVAVNESLAKKPKVWEKQSKGKKKGGKGAKNKKKTSQMVVKKKPQQNASQVSGSLVPSNAVTENGTKSTKQKLTKESDAETDSDDKSDKESDNMSDSENEESNKKVKPTEEVSDREEEEDWDKFQQNVTKKEKVLEAKSKQSHSVHSPYFPDDKQEYWWIYLSDRKRHALITIPYLMTNLVEKEEVVLKFIAPLKPGQYLQLFCDSQK